MAGLYGYGLHKMWRRTGAGHGVSVWRVLAFAGALLAIAIALLSPVDALSDDLSWVHMLQHLILMAVAAPLLVLGYPEFVLLWVLPPRARRALGCWPQRSAVVGVLWRVSWNPLWIWSVHALAIWVWHVPVLYELALNDPLVHDIEHLTFFLAAVLFWRVAIDPRSNLRLNPGLAISRGKTTARTLPITQSPREIFHGQNAHKSVLHEVCDWLKPSGRVRSTARSMYFTCRPRRCT